MYRHATTAAVVLAMAAVLWPTLPAGAGYRGEGPVAWLGMVQADSKAPPMRVTDWEKPDVIDAFTLGIDYRLTSDYIYRGINFSEYSGEGREKPNHQLTFGTAIDTAKLGVPAGTVSMSFWFDWWAGLNDTAAGVNTGSHLVEVDYRVAWGYDIPDVPVAIELGYLAHQFPHVPRLQHMHELFATVALDDSCIFGRRILNPYVSVYHEVDELRYTWFEAGVVHDLALAEYGMGDVPVAKDVTITPSLVLGIDHRFYDEVERKLGMDSSVGTRFGNLSYGLEIGLDVSSMLGMPEEFGQVDLSGFLNFSQQLASHSPLVNDDLYGGMKVAYAW